MPTEVTLANGDILTLKDDVSDEEMRQAVDAHMASLVPAIPAQSVSEKAAGRLQNLQQRALLGDADRPTGQAVSGFLQHVATGAAGAIPELTMQAGRVLNAPGMAIEKALEAATGTKPFKTPAQDLDAWIKGGQEALARKLDSLTTQPDVNVKVGPMTMGTGGLLGSMAPVGLGVAASVLGKAPAATEAAVSMGKAMLEGGGFAAIMDIPNIVGAKNWEQAKERAAEAGVDISMNALLAGGFTGLGKGIEWAEQKLGKTMGEKIARYEGLARTDATGDVGPKAEITPYDEVRAKLAEERVAQRAQEIDQAVEKTAYDHGIQAHEDVIESLKKVATMKQGEVDLAAVDAAKGDLLAARNLSYGEKAQEIINGGAEFLSDIQRTVAPFSRLEGYLERQPFVNFEGRLAEFNEIINPAVHDAIIKAEPNADVRTLVTLVRDPKGREVVAGMSDEASMSNLLGRSPGPQQPGARETRIKDLLEQGKYELPEKVDALVGIASGYYDNMARVAIEAGILTPEQIRDNFTNRIYRPQDVGRVSDFLGARSLNAKNQHSMRRVFEDIYAAADANYKPATLDMADLMTEYGRSVMDSIVKGQLVKDVERVMPGRVRFVGPGQKAPGEFRQVNGWQRRLADGNVALYADKEVHGLLSNALDPSYTKLGGMMKQVEKWNSGYKRIMLMLDTYHWVQVKRAGAAMGYVQPSKGIEALAMDHADHPLVRTLVRNGMNIGSSPDWGWKAQRKAMQMTGLGELASKLNAKWNPVERFSEHLWGTVHRGLKVAVAVGQLKRLLGNDKYMATRTADEAAHAAATFANNAFGGMSWGQHGRSKTFDSVARLALLAPDWVETRARLAYGAVDPVKPSAERGMYQRYWAGHTLQTGLMTATANAIIQQNFPWLRSHPKANWHTAVLPIEDDKGNPVLVDTLGTMGYVLDAAANPGRALGNRQSALVGIGLEAISGKDWKGVPFRPGFFTRENVIYMGKKAVPLPLMISSVDMEMRDGMLASKTTAADVAKMLARSAGTHPSMGYPADLREKFVFLKENRRGVQDRIKLWEGNGRPDVAAGIRKEYNDKVTDLATESDGQYRSEYITSGVNKLLLR